MRGTGYQISLIFLGVLITAMFSVFLYKEVFPEYKIYQNAYVELEEFRSTYTGQPPPPFEKGIKQIVMEKEDKGPADIDRCTSCHVALQFTHFSPTKIATDINGNIVYDESGYPVQVPNEQYIFAKLEEKISELEKDHPRQAAPLKRLNTARFERALTAHPLIGRETRPFAYHPIEEYGCTSCHNGNGRGLTVAKAHGPIYDEQYEAEFMGSKKEFLEKDPENDPQFATVFNNKPSSKLLFQTTPLYVGDLIESKCIQCHKDEKPDLEKERTYIQKGFAHNKKALQTLRKMKEEVAEQGVEKTIAELQDLLKDPALTSEESREIQLQQDFLRKHGKQAPHFIDEEIGRLDAIAAKRNVFATVTGEVNRLLSNFQKGQELFLSQACYACHRIEGFSRGGVGPDLTYEGQSYPWFVKESIVWPQADLPTSTMPSFRLDHEELEDLVTYLLAQHGKPDSISEVEWKKKISAWEGGERLPWERSINPVNLRDVRYGMTVFATEGCAACHRLKGFESNMSVGDPKWFRETFPEEISGKQLALAIKENKEQIAQKITKGARKGAILEEIEANNPGLLESFYPNFSFAMRSVAEEKEAVRKVLMGYIQEYGLGRLIGPRPNWSGIYRTDEWLIGHFKKPSRHIARSIMPVFPFDDSKFYALTYMLDVLAKKNLKELRAVWEKEGFNPASAYQTLCSQCHGEYLHGNGPVSEWIYPIPKNLRNADFLRNYTRDNVIFSVRHGIKGTPMPPWGETAQDKPFANEVPVLTKDEITTLVDWLFSSLAGGTVIRDREDVPKWKYNPEDVLEELEKEGNELKSGQPPENLHLYELEPSFRAWLSHPDQSYFASNQMQAASKVSEVFDSIANPEPGPEKFLYYIKKKYYTAENIQKGQLFFQANCAVCHGRDADGLGFRAGSMYDAKPRMLTNLPWLDMRDDLRLLRSIKYGVSGTSMTPWGDQTSSLQRLQLVIYIRSLSFEQKQRDALIEMLYRVFETADQMLSVARSKEFIAIDTIQNRLEEIAKGLASDKDRESEEVVSLFREKLALEKELKEHTKADQTLLEIKKELVKEKDLYNLIGVQLIGANVIPQMWKSFMKVLEIDNGNYQFEDKELKIDFSQQKEEKIKKLEDKILQELAVQIRELENERTLLEGKILSPEVREQLQTVRTDI